MKRVVCAGVFLVSCNAAIANEIRPVAARALACPPDEVIVRSRRRNDWERVPEHKYATGCGKTVNFVRTCEGQTNCWYSVRHMQESALRTRAAFDLSCAADAISVTRIDQRTSGATGCGQRMTYVLSCPHDMALWSDDCAWVANVESRAQVAPPPAPPEPVPVAPASPAPDDVPDAGTQ